MWKTHFGIFIPGKPHSSLFNALFVFFGYYADNLLEKLGQVYFNHVKIAHFLTVKCACFSFFFNLKWTSIEECCNHLSTG